MIKLQVASREEWGRVLKLAASLYRIVPHESIGLSPFLMMYNREAIMPEEIPHVKFSSNENYKKAVKIILREW